LAKGLAGDIAALLCSLPLSLSLRRNGFTILPPVLLHEQLVMILLLEGTLVSWSLVMDERDGYEDLRGSDRRSVMPYVHGRMELYCSSLPYLCELEPFSSLDRPLSPPISGLGAGQTPCCRAQRLGVANDVLYGASNVDSSCLIALPH
jgi:hypothetical protein